MGTAEGRSLCGRGRRRDVFEVRQNGDFVDYVDLSVFTDVFEAKGWAPTAHVFGGVDVRVLDARTSPSMPGISGHQATRS
jgi:hypothetical protein